MREGEVLWRGIGKVDDSKGYKMMDDLDSMLFWGTFASWTYWRQSREVAFILATVASGMLSHLQRLSASSSRHDLA